MYVFVLNKAVITEVSKSQQTEISPDPPKCEPL